MTVAIKYAYECHFFSFYSSYFRCAVFLNLNPEEIIDNLYVDTSN